ncbi:ComEC/Rec2 family competence protein [Arthrobacter sp. MSA 4-2]|uniref:ComEC/Rec2 family competence protein n=1 Tax=Arthrobacter sp. MSA 4-2 TaxID=2794349 RepID=UPI0018E81B5F|nr:ComEC/Rec2 family competence protein [Arthrobacter sp. MSA 4-2]MBJ2119851.1 ComEC/Rec2 family competence protein [Arthrobacter sp. MSA 4-2]
MTWRALPRAFLGIDASTQAVPPREPDLPTDFRLAPAAAAAWTAAALATRLPAEEASAWGAVVAYAGLTAGLLCFAYRGRVAAALLVPLLLPLAAGCLVMLAASGSLARFTAGPVDEAAREKAFVTVILRPSSDAAPVRADYGEARYILRAIVAAGSRSGRSFTAASPVVVFGDGHWERIGRGDTVRSLGRLRSPDRPGREVAVFLPAAPPVVEPARGAENFTRDLRREFSSRALAREAQDGGLLPGMAIGDRSVLDDRLEEAMKATGLTHLTAVSGTNCSYVLAFAFLAARAARLPRPAAAGAALLALGAFVFLVRPEPSVLRAAVMGAIGIFAVLTGRGRMSLPLLFLTVIVLLAADPWLHSSYAFLLSVSATAGLILIGPLLSSRFAAVLPVWAARLLAVPVAAQLACTPLLVMLQPSLSVYAVPANVAAAPVVPFVTIAGMLAVAAIAVWPPAAEPLLALGQLGSGWVATVARVGSGVPFAQVPWLPGAPGAALAAALSLLVVLAVAAAVRPQRAAGPRRAVVRFGAAALCLVIGCALGAAGVILLQPRSGVPAGWVVAACDVGQGDAFVVNTGPGRALVIDAGPDPGAVDECLADLAVTVVDLLVVTHLHEDHYAGAAGVFEGRQVGELRYSSGEPSLPRELSVLARAAGLEPVRIAAGDFGRAGGVQWEALWPPGPRTGPADSGPSAGAWYGNENDASAVLLVEIPGPVRPATVLFTGDIEQEASRRLLSGYPELARAGVDVLKVPHHGARNGGTAIIKALRPGVALISSGEGNDYGHPHPQVVADLRRQSVYAARTDRLGTFTIALGTAGLEVRTLTD